MLRKILVGTTALLSSQLTEAALSQNDQKYPEDSIYAILAWKLLIGLSAFGLFLYAKESEKTLPIWTYLDFFSYPDKRIEQELRNMTGHNITIDEFREMLDLVRKYESESSFRKYQVDQYSKSAEAGSDLEKQRKEEYAQWVFRNNPMLVKKFSTRNQAFAFFQPVITSTRPLEEKKSEIKKPYKPHKREREKLRAKRLFDLAAANSSSATMETKRNTRS